MRKLAVIIATFGTAITCGNASAWAQVCRDGIIDSGDELCDIQAGTGGGYQFDNDLNCASGVFDYGTLGCDEFCWPDWSGCYKEGEGPAQLCGNGVFEVGEECDGQSFCSGDCKCDLGAYSCGNGCLEGAEECDAGANNSDIDPDACRTDCQWHFCGDGVTDSTEECDDGSSNSDATPDSCRNNCANPGCGDGVIDVWQGEECDNGAGNSDAVVSSCSLICLIPRCGNGYVEGNELCDDGNTLSGDGCSADCHSLEVCGNGIVDQAAGEVCDDGNLADDDGCSAECLREGCGNAVIESDEMCDDGNTISGDGCSADCRSLEVCGNAIVDQAAGESCDDGNAMDDDGCNAACLLEVCGNGVIEGFEECDDGNSLTDDGCSPLCAVEAGWSCDGEPSACTAVAADPDSQEPSQEGSGDEGVEEGDPNDSDGGCSSLPVAGRSGLEWALFLALLLGGCHSVRSRRG